MQLAEADPHLAAASLALGRPFPPRTAYARHLLQRDWFEVKDSARLYAVASFAADGQIAGSTAWAVAMVIARGGAVGDPGEAYLFDQVAQRWLAWQGAWQPIMVPPLPSGLWTGIGARDLTAAGAAAIAEFG